MKYDEYLCMLSVTHPTLITNYFEIVLECSGCGIA